jgi:hypothetical protein
MFGLISYKWIYELDKNMGAALNIIKDKDTVYVIQERQLQEYKLTKEFINSDKVR